MATRTEAERRLNFERAPRRWAWGMSPLRVMTGVVRNCRSRRLNLLLVSRVLVKMIAEPIDSVLYKGKIKKNQYKENLLQIVQ